MSVSDRGSHRVRHYEDYYGFAHSPFTLAPDPRFLFPSRSHRDAIARLLEAIAARRGVAILSGDVGMGKTTVCRAVLGQLDATLFTSLVLNPFLSAEELLREILLDFGVVSREAGRSGRVVAATRQELVKTLREFLASLVPIHASAVLIVDEAQHLSVPVLQEIHFLAGLETNKHRLLQVVLVGQRTLLATLQQPPLRPLDRRVSTRAVLEPLDRAETEAYVAHRLSIGAPARPVSFESTALDGVYAASGGVPRLINLVCDRALMSSAQVEASAVTVEVVRQAAASLGLRAAPPAAGRWRNLVPRWLTRAST